MSWFKKISQVKELAFFLIDNTIFFFSDLHNDWLHNITGFPVPICNTIRYALPRGRCSSDGMTSTIIEASKELKPFKNQMIEKLNIQPMDRPIWDFDSDHYEVKDLNYIADTLMFQVDITTLYNYIDKINNLLPGIKSIILNKHRHQQQVA